MTERPLSYIHEFCRSIRPRDRYPEEKLAAMDPGIVGAVIVLSDHGVETHQSCEGGEGHAYFVPTVDFVGDEGAGEIALGVALQHGLRPRSLMRVWGVTEAGIYEVIWRLEFRRPFRPGSYEAVLA